jgi:murein DD-endopeptidase MepM/ murein hydrolase activator NlpD
MESSSFTNPLAQVPTDILNSPGSRLEARIRMAQSSTGEKQKDELKKVSQEFEAIFIAQLLKVMRETIEESGLTEGGFGKSIYTELFDQEVSLTIARRGALGISDLLRKNLVGQNSEASPAPASTPASGPHPSSQASPANSRASDPNECEISDLQLPVQGPVSSSFGLRRDPFSHNIRFHKGLDLSAPEGLKVVAALPGKVISAGYQSGYGNAVLVQHSGGVQTRYAHLGSVNVRAGDVVDSESILGTVGQTGRSTGPHLHFEVIRLGQAINPLTAADSRVPS